MPKDQKNELLKIEFKEEEIEEIEEVCQALPNYDVFISHK